MDQAHRSVQAVSFHVTQHGDEEEQDRVEDQASDSDVSFVKLEACSASTNTSDDDAHRGRKLWSMPYYVYRMYVRHLRQPPRGRASAPNRIHIGIHIGSIYGSR